MKDSTQNIAYLEQKSIDDMESAHEQREEEELDKVYDEVVAD